MFIYNAIIAFADWAWGIPMLVWLVGGGIILTIAIGGIQFRKLGYCINNTLIKGMKEKKQGEGISSLQCVISALSGTIGTGNIVGVAAGVAFGGPGAVFWPWASSTAKPFWASNTGKRPRATARICTTPVLPST